MTIDGHDTMRAVVVRSLMQFDIEEVPIPEVPEGGMLLKVLACALCGSDLRTMRSGHRRVTFPWIIGHEICGQVLEMGSRYQGAWQKGDVLAVGPITYCGKCRFCLKARHELCIDYREIAQAWPGGFADYIAIPEECVKLGTIRKIPEELDPAYAAITEPISSVVYAQEKGWIGLGDTVMIIGAGPVGCLHAGLARVRGADKVYIADINESRLEMARAFGPDGIVNVSDTNLVTKARALTGGMGPDVVISATPAPAAVVQAVEMAGKGGRILLFGGLPKDDSKPGVDMNIVHYNGLYLIGTTTFAPRHQQIAVQLAASGRLTLDRLVTHRLPLDQFKEGVQLALDGKALKVVFSP